MGWVLRLVETGTEGEARGVDVMEFSRRKSLGDVANWGMTLVEAKQLLGRVQQEIVNAQAQDHAVRRPACSACGDRCHVKDWRRHQVATARLPRFRCVICGRIQTSVDWLSHSRSTPELDRLRAHLSVLMPFRVAAGVLAYLLPVKAGISPETLRGHTLKIGERLRATPTVKPAVTTCKHHRRHGLHLHPSPRRRRTSSGGARRGSGANTNFRRRSQR